MAAGLNGERHGRRKIRRFSGFYRALAAFCVFAAASGLRLWGQDASLSAPPKPEFAEPRTETDAVNFIGMSVAELFENFGPPKAVYPSRGIEVWQDDVVFEYDGVDFYIYRNRVWQLCLDAGAGISKGDPRAAVLLALGGAARDNEKYILGRLPNTSWPLEWRFNIENGKVSAIYLYRMDY
ncbi:MAG: hypothetical protein LBH50_06010 [Spirochaetaceae bacterium]|jgi:hypothetical protein|nr:hypothetical protein [Spirochaetaceae bacterium]